MQKVAVVTGASSGIGLAIAKELIQNDYIVYSFSRSAPKEEKIKHIVCDVSKRESLVSAFKAVYDNEKHIDAVINNAGMGISGPLEYEPEQDINKIMSVNLLGTINSCAVCLPYIRETKGRIINIGSIAGEFGIPFQTLYSVTKAGVMALSMALQNEVRPLGVKITCLMPGDIKTNFTANREKTCDEVDAIYGNRVQNSIKKMEKDEQNGMPPEAIAVAIRKVLAKKNPPMCLTVGFSYKTLRSLKRIFPTKLINKILYSMYGK